MLLPVGVDWTRALLSDDRRVSNVDYLGEPWALRLPPLPVENGEITGHIEDQQGAFNLNNLVRNGKVDLAQLAHFERLLLNLDLPPGLADALADWIDADSLPQPQDGAEDEVYLAMNPPYLAANRPLIDVAELALVKGFDAVVRARLRPFVAALPVFTAVNMNTASPEVIAAVIDGLDLEGARAVVSKRATQAYFRDRADFVGALPGAVLAANEDTAFSSDYFLVQLRVHIGAAEARSEALLARTDGNWPTVLWRKMQ
jgi:general secretion pathway protein K